MAPMMLRAAQAMGGILAAELSSLRRQDSGYRSRHGLFGITVAQRLPKAPHLCPGLGQRTWWPRKRRETWPDGSISPAYRAAPLT